MNVFHLAATGSDPDNFNSALTCLWGPDKPINVFKGIESFGQTGERYVGMYANDTRNGIGTAYYADGATKYFGEWRNGSPGCHWSPFESIYALIVGQLTEKID